jgi:hypothetical protein
MRTFFFAGAIGLITLLASSFVCLSQGPDPNITAKYAIGEIKSIDVAARQMTIKTDAGSIVTVSSWPKVPSPKTANQCPR